LQIFRQIKEKISGINNYTPADIRLFFNGVQTAAGFALWAGGRVSLGALPDRDIIQRYGD
jgi:hypothetical protein